MAGVQWSGGKLTRSKFGAMLRHTEKDERLKREHVNADLDKSKTARNYSVAGLSYQQRLRKLDTRLSEIDTGRRSRGKNERVVAQSLVGYVPPEVEAMGEDAVRQWASLFCACVKELVGEENFIDADVHFDEQHEYVDPATGKTVMSRVHVHVFFVPVVEEEFRQVKEQKLGDDGLPERDARGKIRYKVVGREHVKLDKPKLNASRVASRANMTKLNTLVDDMTFSQFGVRYVTGKGKRGARSKRVEDLKIESFHAAERRLEVIEADIQRANKQLVSVQQSLDDLEPELIRAHGTIAKADKRTHDLEVREHKLDVRAMALDQQEALFVSARRAYERAVDDMRKLGVEYRKLSSVQAVEELDLTPIDDGVKRASKFSGRDFDIRF